MNKIVKFIFESKGGNIAYVLMMTAYAVVPESAYSFYRFNDKWDDTTTIIVNRLVVGVLFFIIANFFYYCWLFYRNQVTLSGENYSIQIEYGDILKVPDGKKVINFDECFTTKVGDAPSEIKPNSVCGQYLKQYPIANIQELIDKAGIKPARGKSEFNNQYRYKPGTLIPNGDYLLMAFAKLDKNGRARLSYDEYLNCLNVLWEQIDIYHGTSDVYIPILGSLITTFEKDLSQQQLLDIMISSYRLSPKNMKKPFKLHIVCKKRKGFSLNDIFGVS